MDSIVELEGTTSRLVRADDLATIDVERSLCAIVNEGNVIPRIRLSTFESTVDLATITELDVQVVVWRRSITEAHVDLRARSPSTEDSLVIDVEAIDIHTHLNREALEVSSGDTTSDSAIVYPLVRTEDRSTCRGDRLDSIDVGVSPIKDRSRGIHALELKGDSILLTEVHLLLRQRLESYLNNFGEDSTSLDDNLRGRESDLTCGEHRVGRPVELVVLIESFLTQLECIGLVLGLGRRDADIDIRRDFAVSQLE